MTLNELIEDLQAWQMNGLGELPIFIRQYDRKDDSIYYDVATNNYELTQIDNKLIFL